MLPETITYKDLNEALSSAPGVQPVTIAEIQVAEGASFALWQEVFGVAKAFVDDPSSLQTLRNVFPQEVQISQNPLAAKVESAFRAFLLGRSNGDAVVLSPWQLVTQQYLGRVRGALSSTFENNKLTILHLEYALAMAGFFIQEQEAEADQLGQNKKYKLCFDPTMAYWSNFAPDAKGGYGSSDELLPFFQLATSIAGGLDTAHPRQHIAMRFFQNGNGNFAQRMMGYYSRVYNFLNTDINYFKQNDPRLKRTLPLEEAPPTGFIDTGRLNGSQGGYV